MGLETTDSLAGRFAIANLTPDDAGSGGPRLPAPAVVDFRDTVVFVVTEVARADRSNESCEL